MDIDVYRKIFHKKGAIKMKCPKCAADAVKSTTTDVTDLGNCLIIIRNVPCYKCTECSEILYTGDVLRKLDAMIAKAKQTLNEISIIDFERTAA